jgi:hypothetical protein
VRDLAELIKLLEGLPSTHPELAGAVLFATLGFFLRELRKLLLPLVALLITKNAIGKGQLDFEVRRLFTISRKEQNPNRRFATADRPKRPLGGRRTVRRQLRPKQSLLPNHQHREANDQPGDDAETQPRSGRSDSAAIIDLEEARDPSPPPPPGVRR